MLSTATSKNTKNIIKKEKTIKKKEWSIPYHNSQAQTNPDAQTLFYQPSYSHYQAITIAVGLVG